MGNKKPMTCAEKRQNQYKCGIKNTINLLGENKERDYLKITKRCPHCRESLDLKNVCVSNGILYCKYCNQSLPIELLEFQEMFEDDIDYSIGVNNTTNEVYPKPLVDIDEIERFPHEIKKYSPYYSFSVAKYALTDVIEAIENDGGKDIIVTKEDDNLIVKYKPNWRK